MSVKIQVRRGTATEWSNANPTLSAGELGYDTTNDILKVGDGSTAWSSLPEADNQSATQVTYSQAGQTYALGNNVQAAIYAIDDELIAQDLRLDTIEADENTVGSIAKALKDAKDYADAEIDAAKLALGTNYSVAGIAARDALEDLTVGDLVFVVDDGDGKWAQYKVTVADPLAFEKIMDEDVYLNAISASAVKTAYESNEDTNAFTDAFRSKLSGIEANAKDDQNAAEVPFDNEFSGLSSTHVQAAIDEVEGRLDTAETKLFNIEDNAKDDQDADEVPFDNTASGLTATDVQAAIDEIDDRLDTVQADENTTGSIAKALKDAKDYADAQDALQDAADEINFAEAGNTYALGATVQAAINAVDDELIAQDVRLDTIEGDEDTPGSIAKALKDAKAYADTQDALQDEADEITYDNTTSQLSATDVQAAIDEVVADLANYEPADATILKSADIGVNVQAYDATILNAADIGVSVQAYDADTVIDANYETFDSSETYANLRAQATTAEDVGLGNVTNESKATMFADPTFTGTVTIDSGASLTGVPDPVNQTDAANKRYVDEVAEGLWTAPAVEVATTANLTATYDNGTAGVGATLNLGPAASLDIDGDTDWSLYDGVLVKDQTNKFENGRYFVSQLGDGSTDWILTRCTLCDTADEIPGRYIFVKGGTVNAGSGWVQVVDDPDTFVVGTDDIDIFQFSGAGTYTAGTGLTLTGTEFSLTGDTFDADGTFASLRAQATTKEDVGLTNVTDDAQVKKAGSSTDGYIPKWSGTDGDAIVDGYGVQTTLSETTTDLVRADAIVAALLDKADKLANIEEKNISVGFTISATEANKVVVINNDANNITITVPTNAANNLPIGTQIAFIRNGSGTVTFASAATILSDGSKKSIKAQYTSVALIKIDDDLWQLVGNLAT